MIDDFASPLLILRAMRSTFMRLGIVKPASEPSPDTLVQRCLEVAKDEYAIYKESKPRRYSHLADQYDCDVALFPEWESSVVKVKLMDAVLVKANQLAESTNVKLVVIIQPSSQDLTVHVRLNYQQFSKFTGYRRTNLSSAVERILQASKIHGLNLFETFLNNNPDTLFLDYGDDHWSNAGQSLAAHAASLYIKSKLLK